MRICIVLPLYKQFDKLTANEVASLHQCFKVLSAYTICFVHPNGLNIEAYQSLAKSKTIVTTTVAFSDHYFKDIAGYNQLLLSTAFYDSFTTFNYILIYQLDAWIFSDELNNWCNKGYDYIGAPWIDENVYSWIVLFPFTMKWYYKIKYKPTTIPIVGNGGLSLRNVQSCLSILANYSKAAQKWSCHEDLFWSFYTCYKTKWFSIPTTKEAVAFSFEFNPEKAFELNGKQLPFGCHAWEKYNPSFWRKYISV